MDNRDSVCAYEIKRNTDKSMNNLISMQIMESGKIN